MRKRPPHYREVNCCLNCKHYRQFNEYPTCNIFRVLVQHISICDRYVYFEEEEIAKTNKTEEE